MLFLARCNDSHRTVPGGLTVQANVFDPVASSGSGRLRVPPPVAVTRAKNHARPDGQRRAGDQLGIDERERAPVIAMYAEAQTVHFESRLPLDEHAVRVTGGFERDHVYGRWP